MLLAGVWLFASIGYIFFISMILLQGLEKAGYAKSEGGSAALFTTALFFILLVAAYKTYSRRLREYKEKYQEYN